MDSNCYNFLSEVLGIDGAQALKKTIAKNPELIGVVIPRAVIAWSSDMPEFEGNIPGDENSYLYFKKTESGYSGTVTVGDSSIPFDSRPSEWLAAAITVSLGIQIKKNEISKNSLVKLGKSIDLLANAKKAARNIPREISSKMKKAFSHGEAARPKEAIPPTPQNGPEGPRKGNSGFRNMKLAKTSEHKDCPVCGESQFADGKYIGCICFADIAKSVKTSRYSDGFVLEFTHGLSPEMYVAIFRNLID